MARAEQRHEAEAARRLQAAAAAQEEALAAVRAQWAGERGAALEAERAAAREQIKDAQGRSVGGRVAGWQGGGAAILGVFNEGGACSQTSSYQACTAG